ncbi:MAG: 50S ribosomal protein L11 methyltransferase [Calditrichaeota bacterium]|nr:MAG: 50S ribosomal protein L11 methyltransferase [Calditrichota bacterium]
MQTFTYKGKGDWLILKMETENEEITGILSFYGAEGIIEDKNGLTAYIEKENFTDELQNILKQLEPNLEIEVNEWLDDGNWFETWKKTIQPISIPPFVVAPTWENPELKPNEILIKIDPKMAFGTGSHETTQLILASLKDYVKPSSIILDLGTGSGILAIGAAKLGAKEIFASDIDEDSILNAQENVEINEVSDKIKLKICDALHSLEEKNDFNLVLVNIHTSVILELLPAFSSFNGIEFILSGILNEEAKKVKSKVLELNGQILNEKFKKEWSFLVVKF